MNATLIGRLEDWASQHKKIYHTLVVSTFTLLGLVPGAVTFFLYAAVQTHVPLTVLQHVAFLCGGTTLLVFGLLLGLLTGCVYYAVDTRYVK